MADEMVTISCRFGGKLKTENGYNPKYAGGRTKITRVNKLCNFNELIESVYKSIKINPLEYTLELFVRMPGLQDETFVVPISDDDDTRAMLNMVTPSHPWIELFVDQTTCQAEYSRILNSDIEGRPGLDQSLPSRCGSIPVVHTQSSFHFESCPPLVSGVGPSNNIPEFVPNIGVSYHDNINVDLDPYVPTVDDNENKNLSENEGDGFDRQLDSMVVAQEEDDRGIDWINNSYANNDDVEYEDPLPDNVNAAEFQAISIAENVQFDVDKFSNIHGYTGFKIGDTFESKEKLKQAITEWSLRNGYGWRKLKSNKTMYTLACSDNKCPWRLHASTPKSSSFFSIKTLNNEHSCSGGGLPENDPRATSRSVCNLLINIIKENLDITPRQIQTIYKDMTFMEIPYVRAWNGRRLALCKIFGDWEKSYEILPRYLEAIKRSNPGTQYKVLTHPDGVFHCAFWAFGPSIEGFRHCRPVLSIDGTHLYGKYGGILLVATGVDADGGLFPLAYAVVEVENTDNWGWFFACIREFVPGIATRQITFISDRQKGIPLALERYWSLAYHHRYCIRHLKANFKKKFSDDALCNSFYQIAIAPEKRLYKTRREKLKEASEEADLWIEDHLNGQESAWALSHDNGRRFCIMTTNSSESFNGVLRGARGLPIQALVARTFYRLNQYFYTRRTQSASWESLLTPSNNLLLDKRAKEARFCSKRRFDTETWEIIDKDGLAYQVIVRNTDRSNRPTMKCSCSCEIPMQQRLACVHAIAACASGNIAYHELSSPYYYVSKYQKSYQAVFKPVLDQRYWPAATQSILPPNYKRGAGRPRSVRIRTNMDGDNIREGRTENRCTRCKQRGHNIRRCPQRE